MATYVFRANCKDQDVNSTFEGGPTWSPRTIRRVTESAEAKTNASGEQPISELQTIHIVFNALRPFQAAHDAVIRALEKAAENERRR